MSRFTLVKHCQKDDCYELIDWQSDEAHLVMFEASWRLLRDFLNQFDWPGQPRCPSCNYYFMPCPHCDRGKVEELLKSRKPAELVRNECPACSGRGFGITGTRKTARVEPCKRCDATGSEETP